MLFKAFDVWKRTEQNLVRYRCFQTLPDGRYCVQSADFYGYPTNKASEEELDRQFLELLLEESPADRSGTFDTIEQAIAAHDADFENA